MQLLVVCALESVCAGNETLCLLDAVELLDVRRQATPGRRLSAGQLLGPGEEVLVGLDVRDGEWRWRGVTVRCVERAVCVEGLLSEVELRERLQDLLVKGVVDLAAVDGLANEGPQGVPGYRVRVYSLTSSAQGVKPLVDAVEHAPLVALVELVDLGPADRGVPESFLHDGVEPGH